MVCREVLSFAYGSMDWGRDIKIGHCKTFGTVNMAAFLCSEQLQFI